jgi:hypothetical protein
MAICICCCANRPVDGRFCICEDYTQIVIEVPGMGGPEGGGCDCTAAILVADFVNELQEFVVDNCKPAPPLFPDFFAKYEVLPTLCGHVDCKIIGPGFSGQLRTRLTPQSAFEGVNFFEGISPDGTQTGSGGFQSNINESCEDFSARYNRQVFEAPGTFTSCTPVIGGSWELQ